jgi:hypothetical protein
MPAPQMRLRNSASLNTKQYSLLRVKRGAAHTAKRIGDGGDSGTELARGEEVEGAKPSSKFRGGQAPLAVQPPQKILRPLFGRLDVTRSLL